MIKTITATLAIIVAFASSPAHIDTGRVEDYNTSQKASECVLSEENIDCGCWIENEPTDAEIDILARVISAEAGSEACTDEMRYYTGSVVLNRVASDKFPDSIYDVVYEAGQYQCVMNGMIDRTPTEASVEIAKDLLWHGSWLPEGVVFGAEFVQGSAVYAKLQNLYFCYE